MCVEGKWNKSNICGWKFLNEMCFHLLSLHEESIRIKLVLFCVCVPLIKTHFHTMGKNPDADET